MGSYSRKDLADRRLVARKLVEPILAGKRDRTVASFYKSAKPYKDGRLHTSLSPIGTSTMRLNSGPSALFDGRNLQNQPNKVATMDELYQVRDIFVARPGFSFLALDYRNAEAILVAAYAKDWEWMNEIVRGEDMHTKHAALAFDIDEKEVTKAQRSTAKNVTYASFYMASTPTIVRTINKDEAIHGMRVTEAEVAPIRRTILSLHPLEQWWYDTRLELRETDGIVENCFGFKRRLHDTDEDYRLKDALSTKPQSTVACCMDMAIEAAVTQLDRPGACEFVLQVHDEMLWEVQDELLASVLTQLREIMEFEFRIHDVPLYLPTEAKIGRRWGKMEKVV